MNEIWAKRMNCERYREYKAKVDEVKGRRKDAAKEEHLVHPGIKRSKGHWTREMRR